MICELGPHRSLHHPPVPARSPSATMPMFILNTNVSHACVPEEFLFEITQHLVQATGKPAQYITVCMVPDQLLNFMGLSDLCALCTLHSIGKILGARTSPTASCCACSLLSDHLHISPGRIYINYNNMNTANSG